MLSFRQAFVLSLTIHLLLLPGMGWLAGGWLKAEPASQIIELELAAGGPGSGIGTAAAATEPADQAQSSGQPPPAPVAPPVLEPLADSIMSPIVSNQVDSIEAQPVRQASLATGNTHSGASGYKPSAAGNAAMSGGLGSGAGSGEGRSASSPAIILPPRVLERQEPEYPMSARRANQEGVVGLRIEILANGSPGNISVAHSSGYPALDTAAEAAVRNWRFVPARNSESGASVTSVTVLSVAFRLR